MRLVMTVIGPLTLLLILLAYAFLWYNKKRKITKILTTWLIFSVTIALMPLIFNAITMIFLSGYDKLTIQNILAQGDLFIVSVAIGSGAIGRVFVQEKGHRIAEIISAGGCFVLVLLSSFLFAWTSAPIEISLNNESVSVVSSVIFFYLVIYDIV